MTVKDKKMPVIVTIFVILIIIAIIVGVSGRKKKKSYDNMTAEEIAADIEAEINEMEIAELSRLGERDRMERYVKKFIDYVEDKNYENAYDLLYDDFKERYFPRFEDFTTYCNKSFPKMMDVNHTNIERTEGNTYVLWVTVSDMLKGKDSSREMNFVIEEKAIADFKLSFSVDTASLNNTNQDIQDNTNSL